MTRYFLFILLLFLSNGVMITAQEGILYSLKDGLSNTLVNDIRQDHDGFIWVATNYGLNRFDGINFKTFNLTNKGKQIANTNKFNTISFDKQGRMLVGTEKGLFYLDYDLEQFEPIEIVEIPELSNSQISNILIDDQENIWVSIDGNGIACITKDPNTEAYCFKYKIFRANLCDVNCLFQASDGRLWIGTLSYGAFRMERESQDMIHYHQLAVEDDLRIVGNSVYTINEDLNKNIILGAFGDGISIINKLTNRNKHLKLAKKDPKSLICQILVDRNNKIIVGSDAEGLYTLDLDEMRLIPFKSIIQDLDLMKSKIHVVYEDRSQNIWIAAYQKGVAIIPKRRGRSHQFIGYDPYSNDFPNKSVLSIAQDKQKRLWIGTDGGGLVKYDLAKQQVEVFTQNSTKNYFPDNIVLGTHIVKDFLWLGTYMSGAVKMNLKTGEQTQYTHSSFSNSVSSNYINTITQDMNNRIWFGTGNAGVCCLDTDGIFRNLYEFTNQGYNISFVYSLFCDKSNKLWIAAKNGIFTVDIRNRILDNLPTLNKALANSAIYSVREDKNGIIWLSNINGLVRYNPLTADIKIIQPQNNSEGNNIANAIEIDDEGNVWGTSSTGIFRYQPETDASDYYPPYVGLPNNEFNPAVSFKNGESEVFFGGLIGVTSFSPLSYNLKKKIPQVFITELKIYNQVPSLTNEEDGGSNKTTIKSIVKKDTLNLNYDQNNFRLQFSTIEYAFPQRVRYKYKLEGYETRWNVVDYQNNQVDYANVPPGEYEFSVMASFDPHFEDYTERKLMVVIHPPLWLTWWAKLLYTILVVALLYYAFSLILKRIETKQELLREKEATEILESQLVSFTNVSHEIRTPLTIIMGLLRKLIKGKENDTEKAYRLMMSNSEKILELTNQLLDIHLLDVGVMPLKYNYIDIIDYCEEIVDSFRPLAAESDIGLSFVRETESLDAIIDPEAFRKILYNLIGNAFKFTPEGGKIKVELAWNNDDTFKIIVQDTGIGIAEEEISKIFDRFYKNNNNDSSQQGIGIGLHLVKSLIELMNGTIAVESEIEGGTRFTILLPIVAQKQDEVGESISEELILQEEDEQQKKINYQIAIVEDDEDILNFISEELGNYFKVLKFSKVDAAYQYILKNQVDLIISDVMMPETDGFEFCRMIKNNPQTELIPFILLTAKNDPQSMIKGTKEGADAYITKPFISEILIAKIHNLINLRNVLSKKHAQNYEIGTIEKLEEYKSQDDKLIERFVSIIKSEIDNPELNIEYLSRELGISRANLYRKVKNKTQQSPSDFIREIRLNQAATLLQKNIAPSEVAYAVGFNSHSYFSKLFQEYFGCAPSEYAKREAEK